MNLLAEKNFHEEMLLVGEPVVGLSNKPQQCSRSLTQLHKYRNYTSITAPTVVECTVFPRR